MAERAASTDKVLAAVTALARDLAPDELALRVARRDALSVDLTVQHAATFAVAIEPGKGALPETVRPMSSMDQLRAELEQRLIAVRHEAGELIDKWVAAHGDTYTSTLPPERCMHERPVLGIQEVCSGCGGRKEVTCGGCGGRGRVTCGSCGGRGRVTCSGCGGSRQTRCVSCGGSGTHEVREFEVSYSDRQGTMNQQHQLTRRVPCSACGGSGHNPCTACSDGTQACTCSGGQVTCGGCGGRGIVPCSRCAATGITNHTGLIQCTVNRGIRVELPSADDEDRHTVRHRVPFERLGAMASETGGVQIQDGKRVEHQATLHYAASIPRECVQATVRDQAMTIRAYGPDRDVFDHHQVVATLLEPDLAGLETSLRGGPLRNAVPGASLAGVTRSFLASELHAMIAEGAPQAADDEPGGCQVSVATIAWNSLTLAPVIRRFRRAGILMKLLMGVVGLNMLFSPEVVLWYLLIAAACAYFERRYQQNPSPPVESAGGSETSGDRSTATVQDAVNSGLVNADYVRRARTAIGRAVPRLYGPLMLPAWLWVTGGLTVLFLVAKQTFPLWTMGQKGFALLALTAVAWFVLERRAYGSQQAMLGPALYGRLKGQFTATRDRYRVLAVGGFLIAWFAADFLVNLAAHLRYGTALFRW